MTRLPETIVPLRELPCKRRIELTPDFVREAIADLPMRVALERPADDPDAGEAVADLDLHGEGQNAFARGTLRGWLSVACGRCVGPVKLALDETLHVTFMPREQIPEDAEDDEEVEVAEDDLDLFPYTGLELDLEPLLREQLILAVPFAPLCNEDCKGLCPVCGVDRNREPCSCEAPIDPRLAALKDVKA